MAAIDFNRLNGPQRKILRETLTSVFRRSRELDMFLVEHGFEPIEDVVEQGPFKHQVFDLIGELTRLGKLGSLMSAVRKAFAENPDLIELEGKLALADAVAENQRVVQGMGLERMVRDAGFADLNLWASRLVAVGRKVCRISYPVTKGLVQASGFLVAKDLVLTNYHVVEDLLKGNAAPSSVRLNFGYAETDKGPATGDQYALTSDWIIAKSPYSVADLSADKGLPRNDELDFALLRLDRPAGEADKRGWFDFSQLPEPASEGAIVFVLQHPSGEPLKQSIGIIKQPATELRMRYDADTWHGSSGGLVLDQQLEPVALHHAGDPASNIKAQFNQGIPLRLIRKALELNPTGARFWTEQSAGAGG